MGGTILSVINKYMRKVEGDLIRMIDRYIFGYNAPTTLTFWNRIYLKRP